MKFSFSEKQNLLLDKIKGIHKDSLVKNIARNSGIVLFGNSALTVFNLISFAIMSSQVGPESLAILVLAQTYALIINDIFNIQTWESMVKFGSEKLETGKIINVVKTNLLLDMASAIAAFILALVLLKSVVHILNWDESFMNIISLYTFSILFNITTLTIGIPRLFDKFLIVAKVQTVVAILKFVFVLYAMLFSKPLIVYIYIYLFAEIFLNLALIIYSLGLVKVNYGKGWWKRGFELDKKQIVFIWWTNLRTIVRIPVRHLDMIIISSVLSIKMVGIYKVYKEIAGLIHRISDPVNQAVFPEFTKLLGKSEMSKTASVTKKTIFMLFGAGAIIVVLMLVSSKFIVGSFFGAEYLMDINVLYCMIVLFGISFVTVPINSLFIAAGFAKYSFMIILFTNSLYLVTAFFFGKQIGLYGIVIAFAVQLFFNKGLKIYYLKKYSGDWGTTIR